MVSACALRPSWVCVVLIIIGALQGLPAQDIPHRSCRNDFDGQGRPTTICFRPVDQQGMPLPQFVAPENFDVNLLQPSLASLIVTALSVRPNYLPLPSRPTLIMVGLSHANLPESDTVFPLNGFLALNKQHIQDLVLIQVKLPSLSREHFSGFNQLRALSLQSCGITAVGLSLFESLGAVPEGTLPVAGFQPQLQSLEISGNLFTTLDWSFLIPVVDTLKVINLNNNSLTSITASTPFQMQATFPRYSRAISLDNNRFTAVPVAVYESLFNVTATSLVKISVASSDYPFCAKLSDCSCCAMAPFANWLEGKNRLDIATTMSCGNMTSGSLQTFLQPNFYNHCPVATTAYPTSDGRRVMVTNFTLGAAAVLLTLRGTR